MGILLVTSILVWNISDVLAWSYVKSGNTFILTLDTGKKVNITSYTYYPADKHLDAVVEANNLTMQDLVNLKMIAHNISDTMGGAKKNYSYDLFIQR